MALDNVVGTITGWVGSVASARGVVLLLCGELAEDHGQATLGISGELPEAVEVDAVAEVGEEWRGDHD